MAETLALTKELNLLCATATRQSWALPGRCSGYSQPGFDGTALPTDTLTAAHRHCRRLLEAGTQRLEPSA